ncbi:MAG: cytochrome c peroxidase [Pirellulaceae bacterium]|nr:cytochrome c peroxidase [Pirellulaceae bacterium]
MPTRQNSATCFLFLLLVTCGVAWADEPQGLGALAMAEFSRPSLLGRFDSNQDGHLDAAERKSLRAAFGGIDVPMLPMRPDRYTLGNGTKHVAFSQLSELDNTGKDNSISNAGATLGRVLFYEKLLSKNNTTACASCHLQEKAFADPRRFSIGFKGDRTGRNSMSLGNGRFTIVNGSSPGFFWDERAVTLEDQALMPIEDKIEMGMKLTDLEQKLRRLPYYPPLFEAAFDSNEVTNDGIAKALAQFMRSMVSFNSKFDRAAEAVGGNDYSQDFDDFTPEENLGKSLFIDGVGNIAELGCAHCHVPPSFGMPRSFNNGLELQYADQGLGARDVPSNAPFTPTNDGKFKASSLRNIALTGPYMHDGRFTTLQQVIEHYSSGVHRHANLEIAIDEEEGAIGKGPSGFRLTRKQKSSLVAFLKTLTDEEFISDPRFSDPFVRLDD